MGSGRNRTTLGVQGRCKGKKEKLTLVAVAALSAAAQEGCSDESFGHACRATE